MLNEFLSIALKHSYWAFKHELTIRKEICAKINDVVRFYPFTIVNVAESLQNKFGPVLTYSL